MAKKKSAVNKSAAIREHLTNNPDAMPQDVSDALRKKGIKVTSQVVSQVKYQMSKRNGAAKRPASPAKSRNGNRASAIEKALPDLVLAKRFADQVGGVDNAIAAVDALGKLS